MNFFLFFFWPLIFHLIFLFTLEHFYMLVFRSFQLVPGNGLL